MNESEVLEMQKNSMSFGVHSENHCHLDRLKKNEQEEEIQQSLNYFKKIGIVSEIKSICYPHGAWNDDTINIAKDKNMVFGLTIKSGEININNIKDKLKLPRLDVNEFF